MTKKKNLVPGRARRQLASRLPRGLSRFRAAAVPDLRGCLRRGDQRRGRARHDPDREFGRRPRRRHPSPDAAVGPAYRRRVVPAGEASIDGAEGRDARRHQDRRKPRPCARPVPQHHPQAEDQGDRCRRYRGLRARSRRARRQDLRVDRAAARRPRSTASISSPRTSRTRPTTPRASSCWRASRNGPKAATARWSPPSSSGCATFRPRSTRRWAASPPTAST